MESKGGVGGERVRACQMGVGREGRWPEKAYIGGRRRDKKGWRRRLGVDGKR